MAADDTPFLSRWSRRKVLVREGVPVADVPPAPALPAPVAMPALAQPAAAESTSPPQPVETPLTLADVAELTTESDYTRFVAQGVKPEVKNAALKKLFTAPHFNVMDGLDTYVDDYSQPDPLPAGMLRQMVQSKLLGLFDDEDAAEQAKDRAAQQADPAPATAAPAPTPEATATAAAPDEDLALQLQPDPAAGCAGLAPGLGEDAGRQR